MKTTTETKPSMRNIDRETMTVWLLSEALHKAESAARRSARLVNGRYSFVSTEGRTK